MSSKLNPKAGAFVPSFVVPVEVVITPALTTTVVAPSPGGSKKNKGNGTSTHKPPKSTRQPVTMVPTEPVTPPPIEIPLPTIYSVDELVEAGRVVRGRQHYSIPELLQFRPFFTAVPPHFDLAGVNATCGGTVKEKTKSAAKRDKQRAAAAAAAAQPVLHYDPNAYAYFPTAAASDPDHKKDKQPRHTPTESPEDEMNDAVANVNSLLDRLPPSDISVDATVHSFHGIPVTCTLSLQAVVGVLFDRAIAAPHLSHFYAPFCSGLSDTLPDFKDGARTVNFRRILLTKCYEALVEEPDHASWRRQSMLGNVGLIGELFRRQLLTENIMHVCVAMMLDSDVDTVQPAPQVLQAACQLLLQVRILSIPPICGMENRSICFVLNVCQNCSVSH
ncbi:hypothetical protein, variant 1 [Aphanomyces astaci]|uniref:MIF4G domain-containing protein n=1 Tax=Aphanomyces astaci TaxID=112090 RepID=W4GRV2_APHAT|nr:hypothetical protein, variant 1 [Aphanomyces astaci]ETV82465.1 hypothetical protein, variant 1 [Aphanomyces astaci]|eukprot:XP_009828134.1 hypothetical protein, variant 1 [Aphanomyces astaci]